MGRGPAPVTSSGHERARGQQKRGRVGQQSLQKMMGERLMGGEHRWWGREGVTVYVEAHQSCFHAPQEGERARGACSAREEHQQYQQTTKEGRDERWRTGLGLEGHRKVRAH